MNFLVIEVENITHKKNLNLRSRIDYLQFLQLLKVNEHKICDKRIFDIIFEHAKYRQKWRHSKQNNDKTNQKLFISYQCKLLLSVSLQHHYDWTFCLCFSTNILKFTFTSGSNRIEREVSKTELYDLTFPFNGSAIL